MKIHLLFIRLLFICLVFMAAAATAAATAPGPVVVVVGTRPEAIKMIPVYLALRSAKIPAILFSTGQHADLLNEIFTLFDLKPDFDLKVMQPGQDLFHITNAVLTRSKEVFLEIHPSLVVVQGDTSSAMAAALAAFYLKIPVAHVEAGLRTNDIYAPFPEEMNRQLLARLATLHFPPTPLAAHNLTDEGVKSDKIFCTGNTVIDALYDVRDRIKAKKILPSPALAERIESIRKANGKILLLTAHRRESFDGGLHRIFSAIKTALEQNPNLYVIYPMHPNPAIKQTLNEIALESLPNMVVIAPIPYQDMVYLLDAVDGVATDSGGIQEEGVSLGKPTLVLRNETDRPEGLQGGLAQLVGTNEAAILAGIEQIVRRDPVGTASTLPSPYGDGLASRRIADQIKKFLNP